MKLYRALKGKLKEQLLSMIWFAKKDPILAAIFACCLASIICDLFKVGAGGVATVISAIAIFILSLLAIKCLAATWAKAYTKARLDTERDFYLHLEVTNALHRKRMMERRKAPEKE